VAINFPTSLDNFTNPVSGNTLDSPSHSLQHSDINDAVEAMQRKVGVGTAVAGSASAGQVLTISAAGTSTWSTPLVDNTAWTDFTPTWTAGAGAAIGNGSMVGRYKQIGKTVFVRYRIVFGSTTNFGSAANWIWSLPITAYYADGTVGHALLFDTSAGSANQGQATLLSSTTVWINITATGAYAVSNATPWTWAVSDSITMNLVYEVA
jgi:hypothetical protein